MYCAPKSKEKKGLLMIQRTTQDFVVTQIHFLLQICSTFYRALDKGWVPGFITLATMTLIPTCQFIQCRNCLVPRRLSRCARKGRWEGPSVPFPWSLAVHHQSLVSRSPLPCEKRSAWGGGWCRKHGRKNNQKEVSSCSISCLLIA